MDADAFRDFCLARAWLAGEDDFHYTEEPADPEQVRALEAFLALPTSPGLDLDLRGEGEDDA